MAKTKVTETQVVEESTGILIEVPPLLDLPMGYLPMRATADLNRPQRETLKRLTESLMSNSCKLADGSLVKNRADALRWLIDQIYLNDSGT